MTSKEFLVKVELYIKKVTCPGVWLCSNGKVSLQMFMLDSSIQTEMHKPYFPIKINEKFLFRKSFGKDRRLTDLHRSLNEQWFYAELVQWKTCNEGYVLAFIQTTLDDLLYPSSFRTYTSGTDLELLMEPTRLFPGTISPKLELYTKTTIEEIFCDENVSSSIVFSIEPQIQRTHPKAVCHSLGYSREQQHLSSKSKKPIFKYTKSGGEFPPLSNNYRKIPKKIKSKQSQDSLMRKQSVGVETTLEQPNCYCSCTPTDLKSGVIALKNDNRSRTSQQHKKNKTYYCSICSQYDCYFYCSKRDPENDFSKTKRYLCSYCRNSPKYHHSYTNPPFIESERKVCCCLMGEGTGEGLVKQFNEKIQDGVSSLRQYVDCERCHDLD